jgi:hypothetical protein
MKSAITAWTCDRCDETLQVNGKAFPRGWSAVRLLTGTEDDQREQAFHFCQECSCVVFAAMRVTPMVSP